MNFATLKGLTIPEGVVTQIADASGRVLWMQPIAGEPIILEVEKITSDTYAGETTYTGEQFILLDIYPKTNGTVKVTYGGLTKTIKDTSGAEEPNAQQVFFGTFNGVSDSVATPTSGELTIKGDYDAFACGSFKKDKTDGGKWVGITKVTSMGEVTYIPSEAFGFALSDGCPFTEVVIPYSVTGIGSFAFYTCRNLTSVTFENPDGWYYIGTDYEGREEITYVTGLSDPAKAATKLKTTGAVENSWSRS